MYRIPEWIVKSDDKYFKELVFPEEMFVDIMGKLLKFGVKKRYDTESLSAEDAFGKYPCMVAHDNYVAREYVIPYFEHITNINAWLTVPQHRSLVWLEELVMTKLHLVTKFLQIKERKVELASVFTYIHSPIRTYYKFKELAEFEECCERYLNLHGDIQAYDLAQDVYDKLSDKLGDNEFFFQGEEPQSKQISSLDLVVYVYLKEQINNIAESKIVTLLNKSYKTLADFIERMDKIINDPNQIMSLRTEELKITHDYEQRQKVVRDFMQPNEYVSTDSQHQEYEDTSEKEQRKLFIRKACITCISAAFMLHLKYARNAFN